MRPLLLLGLYLALDALQPELWPRLTWGTVQGALVALQRGAAVGVQPLGRGYSASLWPDPLEPVCASGAGRTLALAGLAGHRGPR